MPIQLDQFAKFHYFCDRIHTNLQDFLHTPSDDRKSHLERAINDYAEATRNGLKRPNYMDPRARFQ